MSLDIKAGVLTLISPLMEINTLSFVHSLSYKLISSLYKYSPSPLLYCLLYFAPCPRSTRRIFASYLLIAS